MVVGIIILLLVGVLSFVGIIAFPAQKSNRTGLTPTITLIDNQGQPSTVGSPASWYSASVFDNSGRNVTEGQIQVSLTGSFGYNGTVSSWTIAGNMSAITNNGETAKTWTLSASGNSQPPASIPITAQSGPSNALRAILMVQTLQQDDWGSSYGSKSVSFVVNANLVVHGIDGTTQTAAIKNIDIGDVNGLDYEASQVGPGTSTTTNTNTVANPASLGFSAPAGVIGYIQYNVHVVGVPNHGFFEYTGTCPGGSVCEDYTYTTSDLQTWTNGAHIFVEQTEPQTTGVFQYGEYVYTASWESSLPGSGTGGSGKISVTTSVTWYEVVGSTSPSQVNPDAYYSGETKNYGAFYGTPTLNSAVAGASTSLSALQAQFPSNKGYQIYWLFGYPVGSNPVGSNLDVASSGTITTQTTTTTSSSIQTTTTSSSSIQRVGGGGSVVAGTRVLMADGSLRQIQDIKVGDSVMGFDYGTQFNPSGTHSEAPSTVLSIHVVPASVLYTFNGMITSDGIQPFYTQRGWVQAANVSVGDVFFDPTTITSIPVTSITIMHTNATVYDLQLSPYKSYVANGILINDVKFFPLSFSDQVVANAPMIFLVIVAAVGIALVVWKRKHK